MNSVDDSDQQESRDDQGNDAALRTPSRDEIARQIVLDALKTDRHVLETSAATAFRDFSYASQA